MSDEQRPFQHTQKTTIFSALSLVRLSHRRTAAQPLRHAATGRWGECGADRSSHMHTHTITHTHTLSLSLSLFLSLSPSVSLPPPLTSRTASPDKLTLPRDLT